MFRAIIAASLMLLMFGATAFAQVVPEGVSIAPDNIEPLPYARPMIEYACAILFLLVAMGIGFLPSKRVKDA